MDRKLLSTGLVSLVLMILCIFGLFIVLNELKAKPGRIGYHDPLPDFGYCNSQQLRPCVLSFNLDPDGEMIINILTDSLKGFYIKIIHEEAESMYACTRARQYSANVACRGEAMPIGETLSFFVISTEEDATLAQGSFPIIGMALATPEVAITPTYVPAFDHRPR